MSKFQLGAKGRLVENPVGHHVSLTIRDRQYLGEVKSVEHNFFRGYTELTVYHFNGEPWPFKPVVTAVEVIDR